MTSPTDIDALIAALHPHIYTYQYEDKCSLCPDASLDSRRSDTPSISLLDSLAVLLRHYPGCGAVAVTAQTHQHGRASLYVCPSPSIPHGLEDDVREWVAHFLAVRKEHCAGGAPHSDSNTDKFSKSQKRFVLHILHVCYPAMRQRALSRLDVWEPFIKAEIKKNRRRGGPPREELAGELRHFSDLVQSFVRDVSRESLGRDEDALRFYRTCATMREVMKAKTGVLFIDCGIYCDRVYDALEYLRLPLAVSTLLALARNPKFVLKECSVVVLDPAHGSRPFRATMTGEHFEERFGEVSYATRDGILWAFHVDVEDQKEYCGGLEWDGEECVLSSPGPVSAHPEVTLIQHLLEGGDNGSLGEAKGYIACSEIPWYASVWYAGAVNSALGARFTMRTEHRPTAWHRPRLTAPWVLPRGVRQEVVDVLREALLPDLEQLVDEWFRKAV